jgi:hypothetical protein
MSRRDRLITELKTSDSAYQYLSRMGDSRIARLGSPPQRLHQYFSALRAGGDLDLLLDVLFLTSELSLRFYLREMDGLLRALAHSTRARPAIVGPSVPGGVRWGDTERNRRTRRIRTDQFVANEPTKDFAIGPNRVVRSVLEGAIASAKRFLAVFGKGELRVQVTAVRDKCLEALKNPYLRDVVPMDGYDAVVVRSMLEMRQRAYASAGRLASARAAAKKNKDAANWRALVNCIEASFLEPVNDDHLFEVYTLVKTLQVLESIGPPTVIGLLKMNRDALARFGDADKTIAVYFDQSPSVAGLTKHSWYAAIMQAYPSRRNSSVRPDITISVDERAQRRLVFVECKNSTARDYVGRGVYKLIGYLQDFRNPEDDADPALRGILSVPDFEDPPDVEGRISLANPERPSFGHALRIQTGL